jgi:endonuclease/exonuclease/phosphatase family metal-dependent hydrolase
LRTAAGRVSLFNTHLGLFAPERRIQVAALTGQRWLGAVAPNEQVVMCGDLNAGRRSPVYRRLAALLQDVQRADGLRQSARPTFSSRRPRFILDHIFVSDHFRILGVTVPQAELFREVSDHLPLCTDLALDRSAPSRERSR